MRNLYKNLKFYENVQQTVSKNINIKQGMSEKTAKKNSGLVYYKELENNILSSIREGRSLIGKGGALTPLIKKLLEASLEGEIESHLSNEDEEVGMAKVQRLYTQTQIHLSL